MDDIELLGFSLISEHAVHIPCVYLNLNLKKCGYVLIHSHGNSSDIGMLLDSYLDLSYNLSVDVVGYDYPGYGQSTGRSDDFSAIDAINTVYRFVVHELGYDPSKVILYGQSVGSGPSVMLASRKLVGGLIIHSGFMSGLRII